MCLGCSVHHAPATVEMLISANMFELVWIVHVWALLWGPLRASCFHSRPARTCPLVLLGLTNIIGQHYLQFFPCAKYLTWTSKCLQCHIQCLCVGSTMFVSIQLGCVGCRTRSVWWWWEGKVKWIQQKAQMVPTFCRETSKTHQRAWITKCIEVSLSKWIWINMLHLDKCYRSNHDISMNRVTCGQFMSESQRTCMELYC